MIQKDKIMCEECYWTGLRSDLLEAQDPFDAAAKCYGCPECRSINCFTPLCDEEGCKKEASCGWPSDDGYRQTCGKHYREGKKPYSPPYETIDVPMTEEMRREAEQHCAENVRKFIRCDL